MSGAAFSQTPTGKLRGHVYARDAATQRARPVAHAALRLDCDRSPSVFPKANQWGEYSISVPPGTWVVAGVYDKEGNPLELMSGPNSTAEVGSGKQATLNVSTKWKALDEVSIIAVEPGSAVDGVETEFTVEVAYRLESAPEGEIQLGFNSHEATAYRMVEVQPVQTGTGTLKLKANIIPRDWKEKEHFRAFVNLSERNPGVQYFPLAADERRILFAADGTNVGEQR